MSYLRTIAVCVVMIATVLSGTPHAQGPAAIKEMHVVGWAKIIGDNVAGAREQAIADGLVSAVDTAVLSMMPLEAFIQNFKTASEILQGNTGTFIQDYKVLAEQRVGSIYRVAVRATVSVTGIEERFSKAGVLLRQTVKPEILFFVSELNLDEVLPRYWWAADEIFFRSVAESAMTEVMKEKGFTVIDSDGLTRGESLGTESDRADLGGSVAAQIGSRLGAGIVIVGQSKVERTANVMGATTRSFGATINATALRTDTGKEVAAVRQTAVAVNPDEPEGSREALQKAGKLAAEALAQEITAAWGKGVQKAAKVKLVVQGTQNLANFVLFRRMLAGISGVERIKTREMQPDLSTIWVDYSGTPKALADAMMLKTSETFGINITEVSEEHLRIELITK